jgi:FkbM family methyltransferase
MRSYFNRVRTIATHPGNPSAAGALLRAAAGFVRGKLVRRPVIRSIFGDRRIKIYPETTYWRSIHYYGQWCEYQASRFLWQILRPGDNFLDVGANIGYMTILASARIGPAGRIVAVEPNPTNFARLRENCEINGITTVALHQVALGESPGEVWLTLDDTYSRVIDQQQPATTRVEMTTLDGLIGESRFTVFKLDVEGVELSVLRGAARALGDGRLPVILFELNGSSRRYGIEDAAIVDFLKSHGYQVGVYDPTAGRVDWQAPPWDDVIAVNAAGRRLLDERLTPTAEK